MTSEYIKELELQVERDTVLINKLRADNQKQQETIRAFEKTIDNLTATVIKASEQIEMFKTQGS